MDNITINTEYITLTQFLKFAGLISTGGETNFFIESNTININNVHTTVKRKKIYVGDIITINNNKTFKIKQT